MNRHSHWLGLLLLASCCSSPMLAHPGDHHATFADTAQAARGWTLAGSGLHWEGTLLTANSSEAQFLREGGSRMVMAIERLIPADQERIRSRMRMIEQLNKSPAQIRFVQDRQTGDQGLSADGDSLTPARSSLATQPPADPARPTPLGESPATERSPRLPEAATKPSAARDQTQAPPIHQHFLPFQKSLGLSWDARFYYVESQGMPAHPMMIGITAWQQQVPLPQRYMGDNAWQIPLQPRPARVPMSARTNFFRGAIALAINGIPIFNPIKTDGRTDTFLAGELDQWGGHCGRADDYHYHLAPVHLERMAGPDQPIAYALDGYPIYGYQKEQAADYAPLDKLNGHRDKKGHYHYHATKTYPYLNGGFFGEVVERDGQVDPQPRAQSPRAALPPLPGAKSTGFQRREDGQQVRVEFSYRGEQRAVSYRLGDDRTVTFTYDPGSDQKEEQTYRLDNNRASGPDGAPRRGSGAPRNRAESARRGAAGGQRGGPPRDAGTGPEANGPNRFSPNLPPSSTSPPGMPTPAPAPKPASADLDTQARLPDRDMANRGALSGQPTETADGRSSGGRGAMGGQRGSTKKNAATEATTRRPWIEVHATEIDSNHDGIVTETELIAEAERAFIAYAGQAEQRVAVRDLAQRAPVRSAMGGFIREHREELDRDQDGNLTREEILQTAQRMFQRADQDGDGQLPFKPPATPAPPRSPTSSPTDSAATIPLAPTPDTVASSPASQGSDSARDRPSTANPPSSNRSRSAASRPANATETGSARSQPNAARRGRIADHVAPAIVPPQPPAAPSMPPVPTGDAADPSRPRETVRSTQASLPNLILILMDDMGWRDVGFAGNQFVETPHLDRLAAEGIRFTQSYASAPNCAPTRACLMTGQYTPRHGVYTVVDPRHEPGQPHHRILSTPSAEALHGPVVTIAELLKDRGYATACFGMWNLGRGRNGPETPTGQGFDIYKKPQDLGFEQHAYLDHQDRDLTDVLFAEGMQFIEQHQDEPFFLYLPTHAVHAPFEPPAELVEKYRQKARNQQLTKFDPFHAATVESVDLNVGRLMQQLKSLKIDDNTLIVFTSDNGGTPELVAPLNGSKGAIYEGGIRVPCVVWWAGIQNPGRSSHEPIVSMDFYPTLAAVAGAALPPRQPIDGVSLLPILQETGTLNRDAIFWHFPCYIGRGEPCSAIRVGDWKLIEKFAEASLELYNLRDDPGETTNLILKAPTQARNLAEQLRRWQLSVHAPRPTEPNPAFDATTVRGGGRRKPGRN